MTPKLVAVARRMPLWTFALVLPAVLLVWQGCNTSVGGGGGGAADGGTDGVDTEAQVTSLINDQTFSGLQDITIAYCVPETATSVSGIYVVDQDSEDTSAYQTLATALSAGCSSFTFNTGQLPQGRFRLGVCFVSDRGASECALSSGVLSVEGQPHPTFFEPEEDTEVLPGTTVPIIVDLGDPEAEVAWRLFYVRDTSAPDLSTISDANLAQLGNEIETGTGNAVTFDWNTTNVALGTYLLGISATDSGLTVSQTLANGDGEQVVTVYSEVTVTVTDELSDNDNTGQTTPTVSVTEPATDRSIYGTQIIEVVFSAQTYQGTQDEVEVFSEDMTTGEREVRVPGLTTASTSAEFSSAVLDGGTYRIGVTVDDGANSPVSAYAPGLVSIVTDPTLEVTSPDEDIIVRPTDTVSIAWETNVGSDAAEAQVTAQLASGAEDPIEIATSTFTSATWTPGAATPGAYEITVRLIFTETTVADLTATAGGQVRVTTAAPMIWIGCLDPETAPADCVSLVEASGAIFEGANVEDNLGSSFAAAGDMDGDGNDDVLMAARYGKPFFSNPEGMGHGEGYLVYGASSRFSGSLNINTLGTGSLRGVTFTGIRTRQGNTETDGLSALTTVPDVDADGRRELVFGFPNVESRGHNIDPDQDGVADPTTLGSLERPNQFLRGGVVIVSSKNSIVRNPDTGSPVINLDLVGQRFQEMCVRFEPDTEDEEGRVDDIFSIVEDTGGCFDTDGIANGSCDEPSSGDGNDATSMNWGFVAALAEDYFSAMTGTGCLTLSGYEFHLNDCAMVTADGVVRYMTDYCAGIGPGYCLNEGPNLHGAVAWHPDTTLRGVGYSGFYPDQWDTNADNDPDSFSEEDLADNQALEPSGARIIGVGLEDKFGTSITVSDPAGDGTVSLIVTAPERTARGLLYQEGQDWEPDWPETGGEIAGLERPAGTPATNQDSGVAYLFQNRNLWERDSSGDLPPKPHQYIVGEGSHCGQPIHNDGSPGYRILNIAATRIAGDANEKIRNAAFIPDFNGDGRDDFAIGAPDSNRVYIAYRRDPDLESDFVLEKLELSVNDTERLDGALITGSAGSEFAASLANNVDLNGDEVPDLIVGAPEAQANTGEVVIIFSGSDLTTPANGLPIDGDGGLIDRGRAAKITGFPNDAGLFGFNVANGGDIDGDGKNDLLVAAPAASPRYNSNPAVDDTLDSIGLDLDGDGTPSDVGDMDNAGVVYIIWGSNIIEGEVSIADLGSANFDGVILVGRRGGDYLGGGDAGDSAFGGITAKRDRGRSFGLAAAGDTDGDGLGDLLIGSVLATTRIDPETDEGTTHGGEAYLIYGFER